jgi:transcriptional regulator with XRE-family HTH domain
MVIYDFLGGGVILELKKQFGLRLLFLRKKAGLSQKELGEALGLSEGTMSKVERGVHGPKFDNLDVIAKVLDVEVWELFKFD